MCSLCLCGEKRLPRHSPTDLLRKSEGSLLAMTVVVGSRVEGCVRLSRDECEVDDYNHAQCDAVPAEDGEIVFADVVHEEGYDGVGSDE